METLAANPKSIFLLQLTEQLKGWQPMSSKVYGNCEISATTCINTWWIKYFDADDRVILNTLEVIDIPSIASASNRDISFSALRLKNILVFYD